MNNKESTLEQETDLYNENCHINVAISASYFWQANQAKCNTYCAFTYTHLYGLVPLYILNVLVNLTEQAVPIPTFPKMHKRQA